MLSRFAFTLFRVVPGMGGPHYLPVKATNITPAYTPSFAHSDIPHQTEIVYHQQKLLNDLGADFLKEKNFASAEKVLLEGYALNNFHAPINFNLGWLYRDTKDLEKAIEFFRMAHLIAATNPRFRQDYLETLHELFHQAKNKGNYDLAHQCLDELLPFDHYADFARAAKSKLYSKQGNKREAERWATIALELNPHLEDLVKGPDIL